MAKSKFWESITAFESGLSVAEWAWRIGGLIVIGGGGTLTGILAKADPILQKMGPIYWVIFGVLASLVITLIFYLYKSAILKQAEADYRSMLATPANSINPLKDNYADSVIPVEDLRLPMVQLHENKHFKRCKFVGPAAIAILGGNYLNSGFYDCGDIVALPEDVCLTGIVVLKNCTVEQCDFIRVTIFTDINSAKGFAAAGAQVKGLAK